jgi:hypothetical protein
MAQRCYQNACKPVAGALVAACVASITLASCAGGNALNGHPAPSLSTNAPDSTATPLSAGPTQSTASTSGTSSQKVNSRSSNSAPTLGTSSRPPTSQSSRPYRPDSVIAGLFHSSLNPPPCVMVGAGSSDTAFTLQRFVARALCFTGLDTFLPPSLMVTTPEGIRETVTLTYDSGVWADVLIPVPGQGAEASLGEYSFQVTTPIPGSASASPTVGVMTTSGQFTVIPAKQPSAEVGDASMAAGTQASLPVSLPAGSQLYIWFSGFPGYSTVYVSLYGPGAARTYPLLVDLPGVKTDQNGEGTVSWAIPSGATVSSYVLWIDPPPAGCPNPCMGFTITQ